MKEEPTSKTTVALEGTKGSYLIKKMGKATKAFSQMKHKLIELNGISQLIDCLDSGIRQSTEVCLERIQAGLPVLINTGYQGHCVTVLVWGPYFILCNRGGESRKVVEVFKFNPAKFNAEILKNMWDLRNKDKNSYRQLFFDELPLELEFQPQDKLEIALERLSEQSLDMQMTGNCTWASPEASVFNFFALNHLLADEEGKLNKVAGENISSQQVVAIQKQFHIWLTFMQTYNLERYLGTHVIRASETAEKVELHATRRKVTVIDPRIIDDAKYMIRENARKAGVHSQAAHLLNQITPENG